MTFYGGELFFEIFRIERNAKNTVNEGKKGE